MQLSVTWLFHPYNTCPIYDMTPSCVQQSVTRLLYLCDTCPICGMTPSFMQLSVTWLLYLCDTCPICGMTPSFMQLSVTWLFHPCNTCPIYDMTPSSPQRSATKLLHLCDTRPYVPLSMTSYVPLSMTWLSMCVTHILFKTSSSWLQWYPTNLPHLCDTSPYVPLSMTWLFHVCDTYPIYDFFTCTMICDKTPAFMWHASLPSNINNMTFFTYVTYIVFMTCSRVQWYATKLLHLCDTRPCVPLSMTWLFRVYNTHPIYEFFTCTTMCENPASLMWHASLRTTIYDMTPSSVWHITYQQHDSFMCTTICDTTHSCVWHVCLRSGDSWSALQRLKAPPLPPQLVENLKSQLYIDFLKSQPYRHCI